MASTPIFNPEAERAVLGALIRNPTLRAEIRLTPDDFSPDGNRAIFSAFDACLKSDTEFSEYILAERLAGYGVKIGGVMEPLKYIQSLVINTPSDSGAVGLAKEIKRCTIRRELHAIGQEIVALTAEEKVSKDHTVKTAAQLVSDVTSAFNRKVSLLANGSEDNEPKDLYASIRDLLEAENVYDSNSVASPWPLYTDFYGTFDAGQVYSVCARAKSGKSTWVMSMLDQIMRQDENFSALIMDTELTLEEVGFRLVSSLTGIKEYHVRHKTYKRRGKEDMRRKIEAAYDLIDPFINRVDHRYCGGMSWEEIESVIRRWTFKKKVQAGRRVMVVYDYLKFDGTDFDSKNGRDLVIGKKANGVKNLAKELQIPIWALVQASRQNEDTKEGNRVSNGSVVADSDMISRLFTNVYLLQKLTDDERANLFQNKPTDATHSLLPIYTRQLGPEESGKCGRFKYQVTNPTTRKPQDRWADNHICYSFHNFSVSEIATYRDLYERAAAMGGGKSIQPDKPVQGEML